MPNVKTIKPDGTGDFTTLAAWATYAAAQATADQWAECYGGGNLGALTLATWVATPTPVLYPRIYAAPTARHDGKLVNFPPLTAPYVSLTTAGSRFQWSLPSVEVDGLVLYKSSIQALMQANSGGTKYTIKNCIIARTGVSTTGFCFSDNTSTDLAPGNQYFYNNIIYADPSTITTSVNAVLVGDASGTNVLYFANNTFIANGKFSIVVDIECVNTNSVVLNNVVFGVDTAGGQFSFSDANDTGAGEHEASYFRNASEDAGSTFYGDTQEVSVAGAITSYLVSGTNPTPASGSHLVNAATDLHVAYGLPSADAIGTNRPTAAWDIGAIELVSASAPGFLIGRAPIGNGGPI